MTLPDGSQTKVALYARGGAVGIGRLDDRGKVDVVELRMVRTQRNDAESINRALDDTLHLSRAHSAATADSS